jgi:hypothetical protein
LPSSLSTTGLLPEFSTLHQKAQEHPLFLLERQWQNWFQHLPIQLIRAFIPLPSYPIHPLHPVFSCPLPYLFIAHIFPILQYLFPQNNLEVFQCN